MNEKPIEIASTIVLLKEGLLYLKRSPDSSTEPNAWATVGGKIDGETPGEAALRELYEETGIKAGKDELKKITYFEDYIDHRKRGRTPLHVNLFAIDRRSMSLSEIKISDEHSNKRCYSIDFLRNALAENRLHQLGLSSIDVKLISDPKKFRLVENALGASD